MESLKPLAEINEPDLRNTYFVVTDSSARASKLTLEHIHSIVEEIRLLPSVPEAIQSHFAQAQNLAVYSWFHYPFNVTSQFMGFVPVEYALKLRLNSKASFKALIQSAVKSGLIKDNGFAIVAHREPSPNSYVETLIEVMPSLRNRLAHGSNMLHNSSLSSLRICADFINQIFTVQADG